MEKMTNCKACGKEIARGVNKCPNCGKDQRNFLMKHKIITGIVALIILGNIGSAMNGSKNGAITTVDNSKSTSTTDTVTVTKSTKTSNPVVKDFYAINEDVKLNDAIIKVTKIEKSDGSDFDKPKNGMEFVIVTVSIRNSGTGEITYNPFDFKMQNSKGQITDEGFTTINTDTQLNNGSLASGGNISGSIAFEQPKGDNGLILKYKGNMFSNKEIKIKLN